MRNLFDGASVVLSHETHAPARPSPYLGQHPVVEGNSVKLLIDGAETYPAMLAAIERAQRSVVLESYIFAPDRTGHRFLEALVACARRGVGVRVIVDGAGSFDTPASFWRPLCEAGGAVQVFHPWSRLPWRWGALFLKRDHRKLCVVDDHVGFIGGLNIADEYAPVEWEGGAWHDAHAEVVGPAARELVLVFNRSWRRLAGEDYGARVGPGVVAGDVAVQILEGRLGRRLSVRKAYLHAIRHAERTVRITNAYCIPDRPVRRALRGARRRGVTVQLLLAGNSDVPMVKYASRNLYARLMGIGVEIYEWTAEVLHAKTAVIDGVWCSIGSYNLDRRSLLHNLEANIGCADPRLGAALDASFEHDLARAVRIDPDTWHRRSPTDKLLEVLCYQARHLL